jgi:tetratricopeptide (TPR) repeat protein
MEQARQTVKMDPNLWLAHIILGRTYEQKGQLAEAIAEYQKARQIDDSTVEILMDLGRVYGLSGKRAEAEKILAELQERSKRSYVAPFHFAMVYIGLGDKDPAFAWLEKAYEARSWYLTWLKVAPEFDSLRSDPRFADLRRRVGFTP